AIVGAGHATGGGRALALAGRRALADVAAVTRRIRLADLVALPVVRAHDAGVGRFAGDALVGAADTAVAALVEGRPDGDALAATMTTGFRLDVVGAAREGERQPERRHDRCAYLCHAMHPPPRLLVRPDRSGLAGGPPGNCRASIERPRGG